jgi:hypothetical protein
MDRRATLSQEIEAARATHRRNFKLRHHAIALLPVAGHEKRGLYRLLAFERQAAKRKLDARIKALRRASRGVHPGSWKEFLAARAARGDQRAIRRLTRPLRGPTIKSDHRQLHALPSHRARTSRGTIIHNLPGGIRLRESAGSIELLGDARDDALDQLVRVAKERFGTRRVTLLGSRNIQERLSHVAAERGLEIAQERHR